MYKPRRDSYSDRSSGGSRFGGGNSYPRRENRDRGGFGGGRGGDREDRPSFEAICAKCDKPCRVPFRPNGTKPVLCKACFEQEGGSSDRGSSFRDRPSFGGDRDRGSSFRDRPVTRTLGDQVAKPSSNVKIEAQLSRIETKLDTLIKAFNEAMEDVDEDEDEDDEDGVEVVEETTEDAEEETPANAEEKPEEETEIKFA